MNTKEELIKMFTRTLENAEREINIFKADMVKDFERTIKHSDDVFYPTAVRSVCLVVIDLLSSDRSLEDVFNFVDETCFTYFEHFSSSHQSVVLLHRRKGQAWADARKILKANKDR